MQNNNNKIINIARKGFADSLALALYKTDDLLDCLCSRGKEHSLPNVLAELYVRYCFAPSADLKQHLLKLLPESVGDVLLAAANRFPYSEPPFATDLDYGNTRKIKDAIATRWKHFANADGAFPVCSENDAFLLPFYLYEHQENTSWVIDWNGNEIAEWNAAVEKLHIPYQVKVSISGNVKLEGHSLQLPVYLASLVKSSQFLPFDPYRFIATGAIENGLLKSVLFATKYDVLCHKYANALFVCPKPSEDCIIADCNAGVMPVGFSLRDIRNFCSEFIVKHHLLKNEPENKSFSGRQYELSKIHSLLNPYSKQDKKIPLLLGASGIGKTALANQYAQIMTGCEYHDYALVNGDSSSLPDLFDAFYCSQINQQRFCFTIPETLKTPKDKFESFLHQLKRCGKRVLFILDNLSPELQLNEDMKEFFPNYSESCIDFIATANVCQFCVNDDDAVSTLEIDGLSIADGVRLLQNKRIIESAEEKIAAEEIVNFLGGNAWALTVVGETLKQTPEKFDDDYREKLKELRLLPLETLTPNSGMVRISYGKEIDPVKLLQPVLDRLDPETLEIAQVAACCAPEYIYPDWLREYYELQHNVKFENEKQWRRKNIIAKLKQGNILTEHDGLFHVHRLTRWVLQENSKKLAKYRKILIDLISKRAKMQACDIELHAIGEFIVYNQDKTVLSELLKLCIARKRSNFLNMLYVKGQWSIAKEVSSYFSTNINDIQFATETAKKEYLAELIIPCALIELCKGNLDEALRLFSKAQYLQNDSSVATQVSTMCGIASAHIQMEHYYTANNVLQEIQYRIEKDKGVLNTLAYSDFLTLKASLACFEGRWLNAVEIDQENIDLLKRIYPQGSFLEATVKTKMGQHYSNISQWGLALECFDAAEKYYAAYTEYSAWNAQCYAGKSIAYAKLNDWENALLYRKKAYEIDKELYPTNHKTLLYHYWWMYEINIKLGHKTDADKYANKFSLKKQFSYIRHKASLVAQTDIDKARSMLINLVNEIKASPDSESAELAYTLFALGARYNEIKDFVSALECLNNAYEIYKNKFPGEKKYSWDAEYYNNLAIALLGVNQICRAAEEGEKAVKISEELGDLEWEIHCLNTLAKVYRHMQEYSRALEIHESVLEKCKTVKDYSLARLSTIKTNYARTLIELGRYDEAMKLEKESLEFRMATLPAHHENLAINYYDIGQILFKQGNFDKAITSLNSALNVTTMPEYQGRQITSEVIQELLDKIRSCQK